MHEESTRAPNISSPGMNAKRAMKTSFNRQEIGAPMEVNIILPRMNEESHGNGGKYGKCSLQSENCTFDKYHDAS